MKKEYIVFEGVDCVGKSTQISLMQNVLNQDESLFIKEPYNKKGILDAINSNKIDSKEFEYLTFMADRCLLHKELAANDSKLIISDRSVISGLAYNTSVIDNNKMYDIMKEIIIHPTLIIFMQLTKDELIKRLQYKENTTGLDVIEKRGVDYLMELQNNIANVIKAHFSDTNVLYIDANSDPEILHEMIKAHIISMIASHDKVKIIDIDSLFKK